MIVHELAGSGSSKTTILSKVLAFWDMSDRAKTTEGIARSGSAATALTCCPRTLSFKTVLPSCFTDSDGAQAPLPPSMSDSLAAMPGFYGEVSYNITVVVTASLDSKIFKLSPRKKNIHVVLSTPFRYAPKCCPSPLSPFPPNVRKTDTMPVTQFVWTVESRSPEVPPMECQVCDVTKKNLSNLLSHV